MSYYSGGGYYAGGYYAGGVFSFLGGVAKHALKAIPGVGSLIEVGGAVTGTALALHKKSSEANPSFKPNIIGKMLGYKSGDAMTRGGAGGGVPKPSTALPGAGGMIPMGMGGELGPHLRGYRWNKSTYVTRGGGTSRWPVGLQVHPKKTELVKSRRMNVANPRALRRGIRRVRGFVKIARKAVRAVGLTIQRSGRGRAPKRRR